MKITKWIAGLVLVGFATAANAQENHKPAFEIWGEHFGDIEPAGAPAKAGMCSKTPEIPGATICGDFAPKQVAGIGLTSIMRVYMDGKLVSMSFYFPEDGFDRLAEVLTVKYGSPDSTYTTPMQNAMGAHFMNDTRQWNFSDGFLSLSRYGSTISEGSATIGSTAFMLEAGERRRAAAKEAADRDLGAPVKH